MKEPTTLPHHLERTVLIHAPPSTVFRFFTDSERWARWWGAGSTIDARPGGRFLICYPTNVQAAGEVVSVDAPRRLVLTYGYVSGQGIPVGGSRVTIDVDAAPGGGSRVHLRHDIADPAVRDEHVQGWRFQLSLFANVVADEVNANVASRIDAWFDAWAETDPASRERILSEIATADIRVQDRYSNLAGRDDVLAHIAASQRFMPGIRMRRTGDARHVQGTVLADWSATGADGNLRGSGANVFVLGPTGLIEWVTGFWSSA